MVSLSALAAAHQTVPQHDDLDYPSSFGLRRVPHVPIVEQSFQMMHDGSHRWR